MKDKLITILKTVDLDNCQGIYLARCGDTLYLNCKLFTEDVVGIDLECVETCTLESAMAYLLDCPYLM